MMTEAEAAAAAVPLQAHARALADEFEVPALLVHAGVLAEFARGVSMADAAAWLRTIADGIDAMGRSGGSRH